jgi:hypothetical protein
MFKIGKFSNRDMNIKHNIIKYRGIKNIWNINLFMCVFKRNIRMEGIELLWIKIPASIILKSEISWQTQNCIFETELS